MPVAALAAVHIVALAAHNMDIAAVKVVVAVVAIVVASAVMAAVALAIAVQVIAVVMVVAIAADIADTGWVVVALFIPLTTLHNKFMCL